MGAKTEHPKGEAVWLFFFLNFIRYLFIWSVVGLPCRMWAFSSCSEWGLFSLRRSGFSLQWLLPLQRTGFRALGLQWLLQPGSVLVVQGLSCSVACGLFPDQGSNDVPYIARCILNLWTTRESLHGFSDVVSEVTKQSFLPYPMV